MEHMTPDALSRPRSTRAIAAWPFAGPPMGVQDRHAILRHTVQFQVIPQLLQRCPQRPARISTASVEQLANLSLFATVGAVIDHVTAFVDRGTEVEAVFLDLLTPAAQLLGQYWVDDHCTFADVTIGTGHLQAAMRALRPAFLRQTKAVRPGAKRALLLPQAGEQHDFGVRMLSAFFSRAGWDVSVEGAAEQAVRHERFDLAGLSVSHDNMLEPTRHTIAALRAASRNPNIVVLVGGLPFTRDPSLARDVGADGTAADGPAAVRLAATLLPKHTEAAPRPPDRDRTV